MKETPRKKFFEEAFDEKRKKQNTFIIIVLVVTLLVFPPIALIILAIYVIFINYAIQKDFLIRFAKNNNFEFKEKLTKKEVSLLDARLFDHGRNPKVLNIMSKKYSDNKRLMEIFNYSCVVGHGKNSRTLRFTVAKIEFEKTIFPHILLKSKKMSRYGHYNILGTNKDIKISLEKEVSEKFNLYCTQDYEIEVLQIFTKVFLKELSKFKNNFSIEFAENNIYIFRDKTLKTNEGLRELISIVDKTLEISGDLIDRLHDDFSAMNEFYKK
ncbi:hypothetical protein N9L18_00370 [Candidatus Pacebacteria bacterium]|nr:hypothetical protein [Candidatus Paceibacterota bacterium]